MDRLLAGQQLHVDQELSSGNRWLNLILQGDGNLVLYRTQVQQPLWSSGTAGQLVSYVEMQDDGNLVAYSSQRAAFWATGTDGNPGAFVVLQDDGNLVVYSASNTALWASNTVQNFITPTIETVDSRGYSYVETSEWWKDLCSVLPCFSALQWPGYATTVIDDVINGQPVVIQLWKGWCQKFLGLQFFPGGIGAEVGVYRRIPGRLRPTSLPFLPPEYEAFVLGNLQRLADNELWWPAPDLNTRLEFTLINPSTNEAFFSAGPETSYWLAKWMNEPSYVKYCVDQQGRFPILPDAYILEYTINGQRRRWRSFAGSPAVTSWGPDRLDFFGIGTNGHMYQRAWTGSGFGDWVDLGGSFAGSPAVTSWGPDRLDFFGIGTNGRMYQRAWTGSGFGGWVDLGGSFAGSPAVTSRDVNRLDFFGIGTDRNMYHRAWTGTQFGDWNNVAVR
jgi:hypothetical protein